MRVDYYISRLIMEVMDLKVSIGFWVSVKKILDKKKQKMLITFSAFLLKIKVNTSKI